MNPQTPKVTNGFWTSYIDLMCREAIPYQWSALNDRVPDTPPSHSISNFKAAAAALERGGLAPTEKSTHGGWEFQDSDLYKWLEAAANILAFQADDDLQNRVDQTVDLICAAQHPDGYINTFFTLEQLDKKWTNLMDSHELYCCGHLIEAAVALYRATGQDKLLRAAERFALLVGDTFGTGDGKLPGYPGHEVIEMALVRLYRATGNPAHLHLAEYFVCQRGQEPLYFDEERRRHNNPFKWGDSAFQYQYYQAGKPVLAQETAEGHAVRALYLYSGMLDVAYLTGAEDLIEANHRLWKNVTQRQMYITGATGAQAYGESFTCDYDLPNDRAYAETCASIALVFWAARLSSYEARGEYGDILERALYNGVLSGIGLDGKSYFYTNPLEIDTNACAARQDLAHVKTRRQPWFPCACCPPNLARLFSGIAEYAAGIRDGALYIHQYLGVHQDFLPEQGLESLDILTQYPFDGQVQICLSHSRATEMTVALRIPGWCTSWSLVAGNTPVEGVQRDGYLYISRLWEPSTTLTLTLDMPVVPMEGAAHIREDANKLAVMRGPVVYCLEACDNGPELGRLYMDRSAEFSFTAARGLPHTVKALSCAGFYLEEGTGTALYRPAQKRRFSPLQLTWVPYFAWANREPGEMSVYINRIGS